MHHDVRPLEPADAQRLAVLLSRSQEYLAPWDPARPADWTSVEAQWAEVSSAMARTARNEMLALAITTDGQLVGRITLNSIVLGAFRSCTLGYWVDVEHAGNGAATAAVDLAVRIAFDDLGLHRVEAGTLPHNTRSQRVLTKNGFERYGYAPRYLHIAGDWQDHVLFQRLDE